MTLKRKIKRLVRSSDRFNLVKRHMFVMSRERAYRNSDKSSPVAKHCPLRIRIETTNLCNLKCTTCPLSKKSYKKKRQNMDMKLYKKIIDEVKLFKPKPDIILYMGGEPLLNKRLFECIKIAKDAGLYVYFNTNATLLTEEIAGKIFESGIDLINISFDDIPPEQYESMRVNADYNSTLRNILDFLEMKKRTKQKKPLVRINGLRLLEGKLTDNYIKFDASDRFKEIFKDYDIVDFEMTYAHKWAKGDVKKHSRCIVVYRDFCILAGGECVPCCYDLEGLVVLGDVKKDKIMDIWNNEKYQGLRRMLNNLEHDKIKLCKGCHT